MGQDAKFGHGDMVLLVEYEANGPHGTALDAKLGEVKEVRTYQAEGRDPAYMVSWQWRLTSSADEGWEPTMKAKDESGGPYSENELDKPAPSLKDGFELYECALEQAQRCAFQLSEHIKRWTERQATDLQFIE